MATPSELLDKKQLEIIRLIPSSEFTSPIISTITEEEYLSLTNRYNQNNMLSYTHAINMLNTYNLNEKKEEQKLPSQRQMEFNIAKPSTNNNSEEFIELQTKIKDSEDAYHASRERVPKSSNPLQSLLSDSDKNIIPRLLITPEEISGMTISLPSLEQINEDISRISSVYETITDANIKRNETYNLKHMNSIRELYEKPNLPQYIFNHNNFMPIANKLNISRNLLLSNNLINYKVDCSIYNDVFFTSDIHSDLRKFISLLYSGGFVELDFDPYSDDIYDSNFINRIRWIKNNSLLVIIGDLVDGTRTSVLANGSTVNYGTVNDKIGNFEILLHILIHNLRLQALLLNSNILFTYGNHDIVSIFKNTGNYHMYVSPETKNYFYNLMPLRANILKYFYALSPYIVLQLSTPKNSREILCVHGGLHSDALNNSFNKFEIINFLKFQEVLSLTGIYGIDICRELNYDTDANKILFDSEYKSNEDYAFYNNFKEQVANNLKNMCDNYFYNENNWNLLFTRFYASTDRKAVCSSIQYFGDDIKMVVVGHCPTDNQIGLTNIMNNQTNRHLYQDCETMHKSTHLKGCVVSDCSDIQNPGAPTLAFVDTAMSSAFRNRDVAGFMSIPANLSEEEKRNTSFNNRRRHNEMLHLHHDTTLGGINKYYNVVLRLVLPNKIPIKESVYQTNASDTSYPNKISRETIYIPTDQININKDPHEILLYKAPSKAEDDARHKKQMKYLKYKLKYFYLVQKS